MSQKMSHTTSFKCHTMEEDERKFREFMNSEHPEQFKAACRALHLYETEAQGLTPTEVWNEVGAIINKMKTVEAENRDTFMEHVTLWAKRRLRRLEREGVLCERTEEEVNRSLTCILYCLCLWLERASKDPEKNPHNDILDAVVKTIAIIGHPVLLLLQKAINDEGDRLELKSGRVMEELDPLKEEEEWQKQWEKVARHYAQRLEAKVAAGRRDDYDRVWDTLERDERVAAMMKREAHVQGDEQKELGVRYNAKAVFNILGLMFGKGFFCGFGGVAPFAKAATEHENKEKREDVSARADYFKPEKYNIEEQFLGLKPDEMDYVKKLLE